MIAIIEGRRIKKPQRIQLGEERLTMLVGYARPNLADFANDITAKGLLDTVAYRGPVHVLTVSLDLTQHGPLLHAAISRTDADPTWETIKAMKQAVFGDTDAMMVLPTSEFYVNVHRHCFHVWQMPVEWGIG